MTIRYRSRPGVTIGQHRVSTFRVLRQILIETYKDVLGDLVLSNENGILGTRFLSPPSSQCMGIPTVEALKSRPGWILGHAIEG